MPTRGNQLQWFIYPPGGAMMMAAEAIGIQYLKCVPTQSIFSDYLAGIFWDHQYYASAFCFSAVLYESESDTAGETMQI